MKPVIFATWLTIPAMAGGQTTAPSGPSETLFRVSPVSKVLPATVTAAAAPATVHVDALTLLNERWMDEQLCWNFGDTASQTVPDPRTGRAVDLNTACVGPVAAYVYERPGTYTVSLTRTTAAGLTTVYAVDVVVPPSARTVYYVSPDGSGSATGTDPEHPLKTVADVAARLADHTEFRFKRGGTFTTAVELPLKKHDLLLDCYGPATDPLPVINRTSVPQAVAGRPLPATVPAQNSLVFSFWPGLSADVTVRHLRVTSPWTPASTAAGYVYRAPEATFGIIRGSNVTVADCELADLLEGPHGDPAAAGLLLLRDRQVDPLGIPSRTFWLEGTGVVAVGNLSGNSVNESPVRAAATGVVGGLIAFNDVAQQLDPAHGRALAKAAVTLRALSDVTVYGNRVTGAEFSFDPSPASAIDQRVLVSCNTVVGSFFDIKSNVRHAVFGHNDVTRDGGPCITVDPAGAASQNIVDLKFIANTGRGWLDNGRMLQLNAHDETQLQLFEFAPAANVYSRTAGPPK